MQELIKVSTSKGGKLVVSARELYEFLGFDKSHWAKWSEKNIENNEFALQNVDYQVFALKANTQGGRPTKDFAITLDFAKRLAMMARTEKGEQIRSYFIECENNIQQSKAPTTLKEALRLALELEEKRELAEARAEEAESKNSLLMHTNKTYTASEIAKEIGFASAIKLNEFLKDKKVQYKQNGTWLPTAKYSELGYFDIKQEVIGDIVIYHSKITQNGREFILKLHSESF
jgi:phage anti-repressor protein